MNSCAFVGRLVKDPEVRKAGNTQAVSFTIAVRRNVKTSDGKDSDFVKLTAFGPKGEAIAKYLKKGSWVAVNAQYRTSSYEANGQTRYSHDFVVQDFSFVGGKNGGPDSRRVEEDDDDDFFRE